MCVRVSYVYCGSCISPLPLNIILCFLCVSLISLATFHWFSFLITRWSIISVSPFVWTLLHWFRSVVPGCYAVKISSIGLDLYMFVELLFQTDTFDSILRWDTSIGLVISLLSITVTLKNLSFLLHLIFFFWYIDGSKIWTQDLMKTTKIPCHWTNLCGFRYT